MIKAKENEGVVQSLPTLQSWIVWACAGAFYLYEMILRASPSVITEQLMSSFAVSSAALGLLSSFYYYAYVSLQVPCGMIVDWLGPRKIVTYSALLCVIGSMLFATANELWIAQVGRFLIGAGSACAFISCLKIGSQWFLPAQFALIAGLTNMMGTLGGTFSGPPFALLANHFSWRNATLIAAVVGLFVAILAWSLMRDAPEGVEKPERQSSASLLAGLRVIAGNPQNWLFAMFGGLMYVPVSAFCELWAVPYLMNAYSADNHTASTASIMVFIGIAMGSPFMAYISDALKSRVKVMSFSTLVTMTLFIFMIYVDDISFTQMYFILFAIGFASSGQILAFAAVQESNDRELSATAVGFTNAVVMMSGLIFQPLLGMILDTCWDGACLPDGITRLYSESAYQAAMVALPIGMFLSWLLLFFARETHPEK